MNSNIFQIRDDPEEETNRLKSFKDDLVGNKSKHTRLYLGLIFCKICCIGFIVANVMILDYMMDGNFLQFGVKYFETEKTKSGLYGRNETWIDQVIPARTRFA